MIYRTTTTMMMMMIIVHDVRETAETFSFASLLHLVLKTLLRVQR
jgi:hypothetical protein